jgi:hypothetical protein
MSSKTDKPKTKSKEEEQFYQFAKALIAVPRKELDKELAKHAQKKPKPTRRKTRAI